MKDKKILIVEDDAVAGESLKENLIERGYTVVDVCPTGEEALRKTRETRPDIILMDLRMPVMSGYEAISEIRKVNIDIPIIIQTAFAREEDKQKILDSGCNDYLTKPLDEELLIQAIYKYLG